MTKNLTNNLGVSPVILRFYPRLDAGQRELIRRLEGPVLGIAGPGAGKTLSVALRAANILLLGKAEPSELLLCTYNADAAVELRQRLDAVGRAAGYDGDLRQARVCTIHSLCGRLLAADPERVGLSPASACWISRSSGGSCTSGSTRSSDPISPTWRAGAGGSAARW